MEKLKLSITLIYDADPAWYGNENDPNKMSEIDEKNFNDDPDSMLEFLSEHDLSIAVEPDSKQSGDST